MLTNEEMAQLRYRIANDQPEFWGNDPANDFWQGLYERYQLARVAMGLPLAGERLA